MLSQLGFAWRHGATADRVVLDVDKPGHRSLQQSSVNLDVQESLDMVGFPGSGAARGRALQEQVVLAAFALSVAQAGTLAASDVPPERSLDGPQARRLRAAGLLLGEEFAAQGSGVGALVRQRPLQPVIDLEPPVWRGWVSGIPAPR
jgi:hypothetical protein